MEREGEKYKEWSGKDIYEHEGKQWKGVETERNVNINKRKRIEMEVNELECGKEKNIKNEIDERRGNKHKSTNGRIKGIRKI